MVRHPPLPPLGTRRRDQPRQRCPSLPTTSRLPPPTPRLALHLRPSTLPRVPSRRHRSPPRRLAPPRGLTPRDGRRRRDVGAVPCRVVTAGEQRALDDLIELLDLESLEVNLFRGRSPEEWRQRVFGGQVAGQALVAAGRTVDPARALHSCHAYFLPPGDPSVPIIYEVDRIRDGRSFATRRVVAIQRGRAIFSLQASYHAPETGPDHQMSMPRDVPDPESLPDWRTQMAPYKDQ